MTIHFPNGIVIPQTKRGSSHFLQNLNPVPNERQRGDINILCENNR
jgi:hypothetical protein